MLRYIIRWTNQCDNSLSLQKQKSYLLSSLSCILASICRAPSHLPVLHNRHNINIRPAEVTDVPWTMTDPAKIILMEHKVTIPSHGAFPMVSLKANFLNIQPFPTTPPGRAMTSHNLSLATEVTDLC